MGIALDGSAQATFSSATSGSVTLTTTGVNDLVRLGAFFETATGHGGSGALQTITSITDTAGLTWTKRSSFDSWTGDTDHGRLELWEAIAGAPLTADVITIHLDGEIDDCSLAAWGISGADTSTIHDSNASLPALGSSNVSTSSPLSPAFSTTNANDFVIALFGTETGNGTEAAKSGWTMMQNVGNGGGTADSHLFVLYKITSAPLSGDTAGITGSGTFSNFGSIVDAVIQGVSANKPVSSAVMIGF